MKVSITLFLTIILIQTGYTQNTDVLIPAERAREQVIHHKGFSLSYNSAYVLSSWVSYKITKSQVNKAIKPKNKYKPDPEVMTRSASKKDYKKSGFVTAQLASYLDLRGIEGAEEESFYYTNIAPMKPAFHSHIWLRNEDFIRAWSAGTDGFYVVAGSILTDAPFPAIGENNISIPTFFYRAVYDPKNEKAIAFIFRNGTSSGTMKSYAVSIDELEQKAEIDLFPSLEDELEAKIEGDLDLSLWDFEVFK